MHVAVAMFLAVLPGTFLYLLWGFWNLSAPGSTERGHVSFQSPRVSGEMMQVMHGLENSHALVGRICSSMRFPAVAF